jgi:transposase
MVDNARYYKSTMVREYLKNSRIRLKSLLPYSPNLNLIERVWKFFKGKVIKGKFYEKFHQFRQDVQNFFNDMDKYKDELKSGARLAYRKISHNNNRFPLTTNFLLA